MRRNQSIKWDSDFAYAVGLFVADGYLSKDGRHLEFTSKDEEQAKNFAVCLCLNNKITKKSRDRESDKKYFHIQLGDVKLYRFLSDIGIKNGKSLTIEKVDLPQKYFADFLRGFLDGDGSITINSHPESNKLQVKMRFASASKVFLLWLNKMIGKNVGVAGGFITTGSRCWSLVYCKSDSILLIKYLYSPPGVRCLQRKRAIAMMVLDLQEL